jgi:site-specific recombinase XerD
MDGPTADRWRDGLSFLTATNHQYALRYLALLETRRYARSTLQAVLGTLKCLLRHLPETRRTLLQADLSQTTAADITQFISLAQQAGLAPSTVNTKLSMLSAFFTFLLDDGVMLRQPVLRRRHRLLTAAPLPKPMREADLAAFFTVIDAVRDRLIFLLMLRCGLRVSEVCALTWDAVDFQDGTVRINNGKGQVDRLTYVSPDVAQALRTWQAHQPPGPWLFPSRKCQGAPLHRSTINDLMDAYLAAAAIPTPYTPHCLRHTFATQLLNAGVPLEVLKELMGHHSIHVTLRYTQLYDTTKRGQYEQAMAKITQRQALGGR